MKSGNFYMNLMDVKGLQIGEIKRYEGDEHRAAFYTVILTVRCSGSSHEITLFAEDANSLSLTLPPPSQELRQ